MMGSEQIVSTGTLVGILLVILLGFAFVIGVVYLLVRCYRKLSVLEKSIQQDRDKI